MGYDNLIRDSFKEKIQDRKAMNAQSIRMELDKQIEDDRFKTIQKAISDLGHFQDFLSFLGIACAIMLYQFNLNNNLVALKKFTPDKKDDMANFRNENKYTGEGKMFITFTTAAVLGIMSYKNHLICQLKNKYLYEMLRKE